jgi:hypothetical protein
VSEENVEIVRRVAELMSECYRTGRVTDAVLELFAPDFRVDASHRVFNPDTYEGEAGINRMIREANEAWEDFHETTERTGALIFSLDGGRVSSVEVYPNPDEAHKAVGLEG